jgi:tRNA(Ile)-lysidine synthase
MIHLQGRLPQQLGVAVSGGVDSMALLDFLRRGHAVTAYFFDHGTVYGLESRVLVAEYCAQHNVPLRVGQLGKDRPAKLSQEEHWRNERYAWFRQQQDTIVTAHHLDDCVETWVFNMSHGNPWTIPYRHDNVVRPVRITTKQDLVNWATRHGVTWLDDASNQNLDFARNRIRHCILPEILKINPGLSKVIKKKINDENIS